jgi:hypothetical protein
MHSLFQQNMRKVRAGAWSRATVTTYRPNASYVMPLSGATGFTNKPSATEFLSSHSFNFSARVMIVLLEVEWHGCTVVAAVPHCDMRFLHSDCS